MSSINFIDVNAYERLEIPNIRASLLPGCPYYISTKIDEKEQTTTKIHAIMNDGSSIHLTDNILIQGAKYLWKTERFLKAKHSSGKYTISGHIDYIKFDGKLYIEDLKSCKKGGLYWFLKEEIKQMYIIQLSIYAFLYFLNTSYTIEQGVITKIERDNGSIRNRASKEFSLWSPLKTSWHIENHPAVKYMLGEIKEDELIAHTHNYLNLNENSWRCAYCDLKDCKIKEMRR